MQKKEDCSSVIKNFRAKNGLEATDENLIATLHLMNTHGIGLDAALDQSSRSKNDHGVDGWYYDERNRMLFIYQSKFTESKTSALKGFSDLDSARQWAEQIIIEGAVTTVPDNHCLFNLYTQLSRVRQTIHKISFNLISLFSKIEIEDSSEYQYFERTLVKSDLNTFITQNLSGVLVIDASEYNLEPRIPEKVKKYPITKIPNARVTLRNDAHLDLAYVSLHSLVELYRQRGNVLFDKNVRLSLLGKREARVRLVHPMENTLDRITSGELSSAIFPFYHTGVTISASSATDEDSNLLNLESPSIINGCQTVTIANEYLKKLEKQKNNEAIERFKQIKVILKVVVGTTNEELKEITNSNNRQIPIKDWQLFSNEPIHIEIEATLKDIGIFYERQDGKFESLMKNSDNAKNYFATNGTYVKVIDLGQMIALGRGYLDWAAKPSEIFLNKENHDKIFDFSIPNYPKDLIFVYNLYKAMSRGLNTYLELPTHANSHAPKIFKKPIIRAHVNYIALLYFYQSDTKRSVRETYSTTLYKKASPILVDELQGFYQKVVTKIKSWYVDESRDLTIEISKRRREDFFKKLSTELGIRDSGPKPFSNTAINWDEYRQDVSSG